MKNRLFLSAASIILMLAAPANAQSSQEKWGDGAAFNGGILLGDDTAQSDEPSVTTFAAPLIKDKTKVAGSQLNRPKLPLTSSGVVGECAARITIPARYLTDQQQVVIQDEYTKLEFTEPVMQNDTVRVKVRDEYVRYKIRQPRWEVETEEVVTRPEYERLTVRPAQWKYVDETVDISRPRLVWKRGKVAGSDVTRTDPVTGSVFTLVEEPGETRTYRKRVMAFPEQVVASRVPAKSITVTKRVLTDAGGVDPITVPAEWRNYKIERLVKAASPREVSVPAQRKLISTDIMVSPERWEWVPVVCGDKLDSNTVRDIQARLARAKFYDGKMDGAFGPKTRGALKAFQEAEGYYHGGEPTLVTLEKLGLRVGK